MGLPAPEATAYMATAKMKAKGKGIASKQPKYEGYEQMGRPDVKIMKCIGFQKFRYCGENRPGKKYQDKDFLTLALCHLSGKNVRVQIVCFDAERPHEIHPNGLVGRDCEHGVYTKMVPVSKSTQIFRVPYLRTERILTKKTQKEEKSKISTVFEERAKILPSPYREICQRQSGQNQKFDTTRVCFGVICTVENDSSQPLFCLSNVVQNASEKTTLNILKLSTQYVSAQEGGDIDIFTSEDGPPITAGKCMVKVVVNENGGRLLWESAQSTPLQEDILYKRVVSYRVPAYGPNPATDAPVRALVQLSCVQSGQTCEVDFVYQPGADSARRLATIHSNKPLRKRPYVPDPSDDVRLNGADSIKRRVKEKVQNRQNQADPIIVPDEYKTEPIDNSLPVTVTHALSATSAAVPAQDGVPLHQQDDLVLAKDLLTGEVVYLRTQQGNSSDVVMYVHDAQQALTSGGGLTSLTLLSDAPRAVSVPTSEWNTATALPSAANSTIKVLESPTQPRAGNSSSGGPITRRKSKVVSPWIVDEPQNQLLGREESTVGYVRVNEQLKREPAEMGPPILQKRVSINSESVPGVSNNLPSGTLVSLSSNNNLLSLNSLFANGVLEGVRFDETGTLLSSSVFEMVQPYIERMDGSKDA